MTHYIIQRRQKVGKDEYVWQTCRLNLRNIEDALTEVGSMKDNEPGTRMRIIKIVEEVVYEQ